MHGSQSVLFKGCRVLDREGPSVRITLPEHKSEMHLGRRACLNIHSTKVCPWWERVARPLQCHAHAGLLTASYAWSKAVQLRVIPA